ncbi:MAG TPA: ABC transporter ATP-binding protein [Nevskiaceae bacterium]|nr:ABC transporter ATP-binding protein [Nevskiaceae bacterium]
MSLLSVNDLSVAIKTPDGVLRTVDGVSFDVAAGESVGIVGESGSGKTQTALAIMGLLPWNAKARGSIAFDGAELLRMRASKLNRIRGAQIALVFQDPKTSLNPHLTIGVQMAEIAERHLGVSRHEALQQSAQMLDRVRLSGAANALTRYPHEFSGGMRQRIAIAMMLLCKPKLLIADEPTSALDVTIQAQILALLAELQRDLGLAVILISHDLGVVAELCTRTLVMYAGRIMESAPTAALLAQPRNPYSRALLASRLRVDARRRSLLPSIPGQAPTLDERKAGCPFHPRCGAAFDRCAKERPMLRATGGGTTSACHRDEGASPSPDSEFTSKTVGKPL